MILSVLLTSAALADSPAPARNKTDSVPLVHTLTVRLFPQQGRLEMQDVITLPAHPPAALELRMARQLEQVTARMLPPDGAQAAAVDLTVENESGRLRIALPEAAGGRNILLQASCLFQEDVEEAPANMDNPGFGVEGVIHPKGVMLLAGSGWHPMSLHAGGDVFRVTVRAPQGMRAVTTGRLLSLQDEGEESVSVWESPPAASNMGPLPLAAGWWDVQEATPGGVRVLTFLTKENTALAPRYLEASARWITLYERLHGPYPFAQFMVVENFLPTGYGFPGFTLLGGAVLRLPFIPDTSLRHEIAHCWWGNGVYVDYSQGNWCEGLTTYVADYLSEEEKSPEAAREYRLRTLRRYAQLAAGKEDFPLARFASRFSPASQAVGYGKAMFVFHMIRIRLGDEAFWQSLRDFYRNHLFKEAGWEELRAAFVRSGGWDEAESHRFLQQWIARSGAPALALEHVRRERRDGGSGREGWGVQAQLTQREPAYFLPLRVRVDMGNAAVGRAVLLEQGRTAFGVETPGKPHAVAVDPEANCFRLLTPQEIPATVDSLRGSSSLTAVLGAGVPAEYHEALATLLAGIAQPRTRVVEEQSLQEVDLHALAHRDLLFFGRPTTPLAETLLGQVPGLPNPSTIAGGDSQEAVTFWVHGPAATPGPAHGLRSLLDIPAGASVQGVARTAFLLSHYGRYSVLVFRDGQNVLKETWTPGDGPATFRFKEE
ncbi:M1 family aminopeptidase [Megalodesulfovibrio paquesii]